jgi:hypothetical protein
VLIGNGDGTFQGTVPYGTGTFPVSVIAHDFNDDARPDLVVADDGGVSFLMGNTNGTFQAATNASPGGSPFAFAVDDFNGDQRPDLAVANYNISDGGISILLNTCGAEVVQLTIVRAAASVTVSWPMPASGFVLESTPSLSPLAWQPVSEVLMANNGRWEVTVPSNEPQRFFRLHKP